MHLIQASFLSKQWGDPQSAVAGEGGSIDPVGGVPVTHGGSQAFDITPNQGYYVADVLVDEGSVGPVTSYTFDNVVGEHSIVANFAINTYTITATAGANGSISPSGIVSVDHGADQTFTITPYTGHHIAYVKVDGASVGAVSSYTFTNVTANHTIEARFSSGVISAVVDIDPNTLNLKSQSDQNAMTAYIELPTGYDVAQINVATVKLDVMGTMISAQLTPTSVGDYDNDGVPDRMVKFNRQAVIAALAGRTGDIMLTLSGKLSDGTEFNGVDTINVINPGKK